MQPVNPAQPPVVAPPVIQRSKWETAKKIALYAVRILALAVLFYLNPLTLLIGIAVGFCADEFVARQIEKVKLVFKHTPVPIMIGVGVGSLLCLQVISGGASFVYGTYCGSKLARYVRDREANAAGGGIAQMPAAGANG